MLETQMRGVDSFWNEYGAEEWSDAVVAALKLGGVDNLFFVSGSEIAFYQEAIAKAEQRGWPAPRLITMMHESVTLNAAIGNAMVRNQPAATAVHVDVGTLHYGAALHTAWRGCNPILMMAGTGPRAFPGSMTGGRDNPVQWYQEPRDQGEIVRQYTKADHRLEHQDNPGLMVSRLLQIAMSEPRGPVYLSVPRETAMLSLPGSTRFPTRDQLGLARPTWPDPDDAREIARWLVHAENPCFYVGRVGRDPEAVEELVRLAELLGIPVMQSGNADRLNFPTTHALFGTGPRPRDVDVAVVWEEIMPYMPGVDAPGADAKIAWISADPVLSRFKTMEFRADRWLPATAVNVARAIHEAATGMLMASDLSRIAERRERFARQKHERAARDEALAIEAGQRAQPDGRWVGYQLGKLLEPDAILLNDALSNSEMVQAYARRAQPGTYFRSGSSSGGWGSGAAFGAKIAAPDRDVVLASGDGYYMFGTPEAALWAARYHKAAYLSVIFVNGTYSTGTTGLRATYPEGFAVGGNNYAGGTFDPPPDYAKLAEAAGGYGEYVTETAQVGPALQRGLDAVRRESIPAVIAVRVPGPLQES
ncbi:MAG: acetolactate synthase large subunit [Chloroflexota bacterium]|nr:acetolactate synthase large subunit [Chloroflexota bacterium]